jgi:hypothetical protein
MAAVTHKGNRVSNVMNFKKVDAEKYIKKEYQTVCRLVKALDVQMKIVK